jgi:hypothetical protein
LYRVADCLAMVAITGQTQPVVVHEALPTTEELS